MNIPVRGIEDAKAGGRRENGLSEEHKEGQSCPNSEARRSVVGSHGPC